MVFIVFILFENKSKNHTEKTIIGTEKKTNGVNPIFSKLSITLSMIFPKSHSIILFRISKRYNIFLVVSLSENGRSFSPFRHIPRLHLRSILQRR